MSDKKATVIVPTTGDRGALLPYSVGTVLQQTVKDIEIFIIGDGVDDSTRGIIYELINNDSRIKFFDNPKDEIRGEIYRHRALKEAKGKIVCYLLDRDLMLPYHIENLLKYLDKYNYVSSLPYRIYKNYANSRLFYKGEPNYRFKNEVNSFQNVNNLELDERTVNFNFNDGKKLNLVRGSQLSCLSHTLDFYNKLPYGWRTTPHFYYTDQFMQLQIFSHEACNPYFGISPPSVLYFKRGHFPGISVESRVKELQYWYLLIQNNRYKSKIQRLLLQGKIYYLNRKLLKYSKRRVRKVRRRIYSFFR